MEIKYTSEQIAEARAWLADCVWEDMEPEDFERLSPLTVARGVNHHYDGGWPAFTAACASGGAL